MSGERRRQIYLARSRMIDTARTLERDTVRGDALQDRRLTASRLQRIFDRDVVAEPVLDCDARLHTVQPVESLSDGVFRSIALDTDHRNIRPFRRPCAAMMRSRPHGDSPYGSRPSRETLPVANNDPLVAPQPVEKLLPVRQQQRSRHERTLRQLVGYQRADRSSPDDGHPHAVTIGTSGGRLAGLGRERRDEGFGRGRGGRQRWRGGGGVGPAPPRWGGLLMHVCMCILNIWALGALGLLG